MQNAVAIASLRIASTSVAPMIAPTSSSQRAIVLRWIVAPSRANRSSCRCSGRPSQNLSLAMWASSEGNAYEPGSSCGGIAAVTIVGLEVFEAAAGAAIAGAAGAGAGPSGVGAGAADEIVSSIGGTSTCDTFADVVASTFATSTERVVSWGAAMVAQATSTSAAPVAKDASAADGIAST